MPCSSDGSEGHDATIRPQRQVKKRKLSPLTSRGPALPLPSAALSSRLISDREVQNPLTTISFPFLPETWAKEADHPCPERSQRRGGSHKPLRSTADLGHPSPSKSTYRQAQHARSKICSNQGPAPEAATARSIKTGNNLFPAGFSYAARPRTSHRETR